MEKFMRIPNMRISRGIYQDKMRFLSNGMKPTSCHQQIGQKRPLSAISNRTKVKPRVKQSIAGAPGGHFHDLNGHSNGIMSSLTDEVNVLERVLSPTCELEDRSPPTFESPTPVSFPTLIPDGVTMISTKQEADRVLKMLMELNEEELQHTWFGCDTETKGVDPRSQSPVGNGRVICTSIYGGPHFDFGMGPNIWIDSFRGEASAAKEDGREVLEVFRPFLESSKHKKVWHNYSFDRHVLYNDPHRINCLGFGGDTMHMGRLLLTGSVESYSLENLSKAVLRLSDQKISMKDRFKRPKIRKDGTPGKVMEMPEMEELHLGSGTRKEWIEYSVEDARVTWELHQYLKKELQLTPLVPKEVGCKDPSVPGPQVPEVWLGEYSKAEMGSLWDYYLKYMLPFGEMLTDMERNGVYVRRNFLEDIGRQADERVVEHLNDFRSWAMKYCPDAEFMNLNSNKQLQHFFFAPFVTDGVKVPRIREFKTENTTGYIEPGNSKPLKTRTIKIRGLGVNAKQYRKKPTANPSMDEATLRSLAGNPTKTKLKDGEKVPDPVFGALAILRGFNTKSKRLEACLAVESLIKAKAVNKLNSTYIRPLQVMSERTGRVHCSLNINTNTGRLSARNPNLQNQPAYDKDIFNIRSAFAAQEGNKLVVADYGQLELRLLAHMSNCRSMLDAFSAGGDFHSRTALGMYENLQKAVANEEVLLEWKGEGEQPKPLLKDVFAAERRKAKTLNFSIAYGKTAQGLAKDWGTSVQEAKDTLELWYSDRPEVRDWQERFKQMNFDHKFVVTMMGRRRYLPREANNAALASTNRAAINTPIQGGAADLMMCAMIKIHNDEALKRMGYRLLLQIHDEVILEGPARFAEEAKERLVDCMVNPFGKDVQLRVALSVDAAIGDTWFEAK